MGALENAASLGRSNNWQDWVVAAAAYTARTVLLEPESTPDHEIRLKLAKIVISNPDFLKNRLTWILATTPSLAQRGNIPSEVGEANVIAEVAAIWTFLAQMTVADL